MKLRSAVPSALAAAGLLLAGACGSSGTPARGTSRVVGTTRPCTPPSTRPASEVDVTALLPTGITLPADATIVATTDDGSTKTVVARTGDTPKAVHEHYRKQAETAGYHVTHEDDEGFEAELFFTLADGSTAVAQEVKAKCPDGVTQTLVSVVAAGHGTPTTIEHEGTDHDGE